MPGTNPTQKRASPPEWFKARGAPLHPVPRRPCPETRPALRPRCPSGSHAKLGRLEPLRVQYSTFCNVGYSYLSQNHCLSNVFCGFALSSAVPCPRVHKFLAGVVMRPYFLGGVSRPEIIKRQLERLVRHRQRPFIAQPCNQVRVQPSRSLRFNGFSRHCSPPGNTVAAGPQALRLPSKTNHMRPPHPAALLPFQNTGQRPGAMARGAFSFCAAFSALLTSSIQTRRPGSFGFGQVQRHFANCPHEDDFIVADNLQPGVLAKLIKPVA